MPNCFGCSRPLPIDKLSNFTCSMSCNHRMHYHSIAIRYMRSKYQNPVVQAIELGVLCYVAKKKVVEV